MRYTVTVLDALPHGHRFHEWRGLTLTAAWRKVTRHARRGVRLYGGTVDVSNWGARGGDFPKAYRSAVISLDNPARPRFDQTGRRSWRAQALS